MSTPDVKKGSLVSSAAVVSGSTAISRVLGLIREQVMAYFFGASLATDAFVTAFRIPNLLRDMFAEGALSSAFVPVFKETLVTGDREEAFSLADRVIILILLTVGTIVVLGIVAAPAIIYLTANGFTEDPVKFSLTVSLTRLMFFYLLLISLSALIMGMLNSFGRFGIPALSPAMFNIGMILSVLMLYRHLDVPVYALAIGVLVGGVGQLVVQLPLLFKLGYRWRPSFDLLHEKVKKVLRLFVPMVIGMSASRINIIVNTLLASFLMEGSISFLNYSYRLMHFPLGVFAVALGTVSLPKASELAAHRDHVGLGRMFSETLTVNLLVILPSAAFLALFAHDIIRLVYQHGAFTDGDTANTTLALLHYSYGLIGFAAVRVTVPFFYALGDSRLPTRISIIAVVLNMVLYLPLIKIMDFAGLAAATSIAGLVNAGLLAAYLPRKGVSVPAGRMVFNSVRILVAAVLAFYAARMLPWPAFPVASESLSAVVALLCRGLAGLLLYVLLCLLLRVEGLRLIIKRNRR